MNSDSKGRDIFYGVVAVATLIVAIIGATLAYFSVTASSNEGAINATAAIVSIEYNDGSQVTAQADKLIPSTLSVVQQVYEKNIKTLTATEGEEPMGNACIDDNSKQVCSAYRFTVKSDDARSITATLNNEFNGFSYLSYAVYDITNEKWIPLDDSGVEFDLPIRACSNEDEDSENDCYSGTPKIYNSNAINSIFGITLDNNNTVKKPMEIGAGVTQEYELVLFIKENNENQNIDQGKSYSGTLVVEVVDGGSQITGCVGDDC